MTSTTTLPRRANAPSAPRSKDLAAIGIGIDTARYLVTWFLSCGRIANQPPKNYSLLGEPRQLPGIAANVCRNNFTSNIRRRTSMSVSMPPDNMPKIWSTFCAAWHCP